MVKRKNKEIFSWTNEKEQLLLKVRVCNTLLLPLVVESQLIRTNQEGNAGDCL